VHDLRYILLLIRHLPVFKEAEITLAAENYMIYSFIPRVLPASLRRFVTSISSWLGATEPDGDYEPL